MRYPGYKVDSCSTHTVAPRERAEYWDALVDSYHCLMSNEFGRRDDFRGETTRLRTNRYQLVSWRAEKVVYRRTPRDIRIEPDENYRLLLPVEGSLVLSQEERAARLAPGGAALASMGQPFELRHESPARCLVLTMPRREIDNRLNKPLYAPSRVDLSFGLGYMVSNLAFGLFEERETLTEWQFDAVCVRLVELLSMLLLGDGCPTTDHAEQVAGAVRQYVRAHAGDPDLTGRSVAYALGWSLRHVQRCLHQAGTTPRALIKQEHLNTAYERLHSPMFRRWSITDIAHQLGFSSASAFSTAFREQFGLCPRDVRARAFGDTGPSGRAGLPDHSSRAG